MKNMTMSGGLNKTDKGRRDKNKQTMSTGGTKKISTPKTWDNTSEPVDFNPYLHMQQTASSQLFSVDYDP